MLTCIPVPVQNVSLGIVETFEIPFLIPNPGNFRICDSVNIKGSKLYLPFRYRKQGFHKPFFPERGVIKPSGDPLEYVVGDEIVNEVAEYVENQTLPIFSYYDKNNNLIADPNSDKSDIRLVQILLKINVTPERAPNDYDVTMDVMLRNLKDNL